MSAVRQLQDNLGRRITYLRVSVTDRCDLRCRYCMPETMRFMPPRDLLKLDELALVAERFVERGVRKIRLTGGEPLMRAGVLDLAARLGALNPGRLDELTLTTNGTRLAECAQALVDAGVKRVNVSLDTLVPETYRAITRTGSLSKVVEGIAAASRAGLQIKINMVALKGINEAEISAMIDWCDERGHHLTLIETMPLGDTGEDRTDHYLPLDGVRRRLEEHYDLLPDPHRSGGPALYYRIAGKRVRLGFITPMTHNFCESCNRVRLAADGKLYMCLGHEDHVDLRAALRSGGIEALDAALDAALISKHARHDFLIGSAEPRGSISRHMSVTGG